MPLANRLLSSLPGESKARLLDAAEEVELGARDILFTAHRQLAHGFFPLDCVISLTLTLRNGAIVEAGIAGNEGMLGVGVVLEDDQCPLDAWCQVPGKLLRVPANVLRAERARSPDLHRLAQRYALALTHQVAQSSACYRWHAVEERLCRRLLMIHDRVGSSEIRVTQEILGEIMSARRADVSVALSALADAGAIARQRGMIEIVDRAALESGSCECYARVKGEHARLLT